MVRKLVAAFSVVLATAIVANGGVAFAVPSADISGTETTNGVTSVARTGTVTVFGTATNLGARGDGTGNPTCKPGSSPTVCSAVRLTSNWHVSGGTIVAYSTSQGTCTTATAAHPSGDPYTEDCNSGVLNLPGQSVASSITVKPTSDPTKHVLEVTFTAGPQLTDGNWSNNKQKLFLKITG